MLWKLEAAAATKISSIFCQVIKAEVGKQIPSTPPAWHSIIISFNFLEVKDGLITNFLLVLSMAEILIITLEVWVDIESAAAIFDSLSIGIAG